MVEIAKSACNRWIEKPHAMVRELFNTTPDPWQDDVLEAFPHRPRQAMRACKGPGKTAVLSWLAWNFLLTRPHPKIAATSITADNLADGLWTEMANWQRRSPLLLEAFQWTKTRIFAKDAPETWWMSARTWPRTADANAQADTLAGLHADYLLFLIDEAGGIPDAVMAAAEAGLANAGDEGREAHIVMAGNPTHLEGPLYRACTTESHLWDVTTISSDPDDPKRTPRVSVEWARQQIEKYGRDNPWVLVNVFGRFPPSSLNSLLGPDEVRDAMQRMYTVDQLRAYPYVLGVDVARFGDDASAIIGRQGPQAFKPLVLRNVDSLQGAGRVARTWEEQAADACFIDDSGGYGSGWIDQLRALRRTPIGISFAGEPMDKRYFNKRTEMHWELAQWVKGGGALPNIPELIAELTAPTYSFRGDRMLLEPKELIKQRLGRSPDIADALALTFAQPIAPKQLDQQMRDELVRMGIAARPATTSDYDPWS